jgi:hypothetical protein
MPSFRVKANLWLCIVGLYIDIAVWGQINRPFIAKCLFCVQWFEVRGNFSFCWTISLECKSVTDFDLGFKLDKHPRPFFEHLDRYAVSAHNLHALRCSSSLNTSISVPFLSSINHLNTWHSVEVVQAWIPGTVPRSSSDVILCPGTKTRANSFDK